MLACVSRTPPSASPKGASSHCLSAKPPVACIVIRTASVPRRCDEPGSGGNRTHDHCVRYTCHLLSGSCGSTPMRASRLLSILLLLQTRGRMTAQELADELEVSLRTVYRDME